MRSGSEPLFDRHRAAWGTRNILKQEGGGGLCNIVNTLTATDLYTLNG